MGSRPEIYERVLTVIQQGSGAPVSVPNLAKLLGVKPTTLNARFRRERIVVQTVGRTNYIPPELALRLAELHKYALFGWPTLQEASVLTAMKDGTLKARCEKGKLEGYIDLTKRLRLNPAALQGLQLRQTGNTPNNHRTSVQTFAENLFPTRVPRGAPSGAGDADSASERFTNNRARSGTASGSVALRNGRREATVFPSQPRPAPPAPEPRIEFITRKNYGLPESDEDLESHRPCPTPRLARQARSAWLEYSPDQPLSISECSVGKAIHYGPNDGTIVRLIDDPFTPRIQVHFPEHPHPAMREVQLVVGRRKLRN